MISCKEAVSNLPKRFCMVGTRYFASASNGWYSIWYHNYGRTWSITSLPELVFRRRRAVFILLVMPPTSTEGGVKGVGWLIQASAWNQTYRSTNDWCEALASAKGCFLCFCFGATQYLSTLPCCASLTNDELVVCSMKKSIHIGGDVDALYC